ncbi:helix-turn-helix transcriptional regulator [Thalassotalea nanhaiensis]|uniref:Helix-turn-helix transcriptional regulator n=1 Tax=Thalassotalea nanhaiensis TaxID=3065648 RepID=A0ABY9TJ64_9GAMM|nr:helix-turn-helix transcriptional regulator [Colwelliaceae bacterium SQ345]
MSSNDRVGCVDLSSRILLLSGNLNIDFIEGDREMKMQVNGEKIKHLREQRCWSQLQLAEMSGISTRTLQRLEAKSTASQETIKSIAAVFELNCDLLLPEDTIKPLDKEADLEHVIDAKLAIDEEITLDEVTDKKHARHKFYFSLICLITAISFGFWGVFSALDAQKISFESFQLLKNGLSIVLLVSIAFTIFRAYRKGIISRPNIL